MDRCRKVIIVGAGPAGSTCALMLRRHGIADVTLVERRDRIIDKACAGGISPRAIGLLRGLGALDPLPKQAMVISRARVVPPVGEAQCVAGPELALVVPRSVFDLHLLRQALAAGATLRRGVAVDHLLRRGDRVVGVAAGAWEGEADLVVLASGARNTLSWDPRPKERLDGVVRRFEGSSAPSDQVQLAFHGAIKPHYAWLFPEPGGIVNVGLCREHRPGQRAIAAQLDEIAPEVFPDLKGARPIEKVRGHPIVFASRARHLVIPGAVAVGEAARLTDGFTGEGIWHALRSGVEAARAISEGDPLHYQRRARWVFDPVLGAADLFKRFACTRWFDRTIALSTTKPINLFLLRSLTGLSS